VAHPFSAALHTDFYQLTMAYGYWKLGMAETEAVFHLTFRRKPFGGAYAVVAGLESVISALTDFRFTPDDLEYLRQFFDAPFLEYLANLEPRLSLDAMAEGTVAFPGEPLLRVQGPILQCQLVETLLLNLVNFETLIATKGSRVAYAAKGDEVIEFGMRRAQGVDGATSATRATFVGGCHSTSNTLAGKLFGIPVRGTQAHSWVMAFDHEQEAFDAYAEVWPDNCILLIDTYDSVQGVERAIEVAKRGTRLLGVRLDSGDLLQLSRQVRAKLDAAGLHDTAIVASNNLDEWEIERLKREGSPISIWGVGTHMVTGYGQPALGGVYKLGAIRERGGEWSYRMKTSDEIRKSTEPGILQVRRTRSGDLIYDADNPPPGEGEDLLLPIFREGRCVYTQPPLIEIRERAIAALNALPDGVRRLKDPDPYSVEVEPELAKRKQALAEEVGQ
jgi:nicotinate phosphoribosyltransferase